MELLITCVGETIEKEIINNVRDEDGDGDGCKYEFLSKRELERDRASRQLRRPRGSA